MSNTKMSEAFSLPITVETGLEREMIYDRHHDFLLSVNEDVNPHAICRAVNSHDELVKALEELLGEITEMAELGECDSSWCADGKEAARKALASARGDNHDS